MKLYIFIIISSLMLFGCKNDNLKAKGDIAYLGGEIINPCNKFIILSNSGHVLDTIKLDGRNRFIYKIEDLKKGVYTFKHGVEFQIVLLEPNDSILFRLNTLEFDESLVFTGNGAKKNNYFINDFLDNEKNEKKIYNYCQLAPEAYTKKIDSLKRAKDKKLNTFKKKYATSNLFEDIAKTSNEYAYYFSKEVYPLWHRGGSKQDILKSLPENFYNYRKNIRYDDFLKDNFAYNTFLKSSFNNLALQEHLEHNDDGTAYMKWSLCYNLDRLSLIDSLVTNQYIKDELLYHFTINYISRSNNLENNNKILKAYLSKSTNEKGKKMMTHFSNSLERLKKGKDFPNIKIVDYNNSEHNIHEIIKSPIVISFWSHQYFNHFKNSHYKVNKLKEKYPEVKFISINIDGYQLDKSKSLLKNNRFRCEDEYYFKNPKKSVELLAIHPMTKTIIIDENQKIISGNSNIFSSKFEEQLLGLINN